MCVASHQNVVTLFVPNDNVPPAIAVRAGHHSAELDEPVVVEDVANFKAVVVAEEVVPFVDVDPYYTGLDTSPKNFKF